MNVTKSSIYVIQGRYLNQVYSLLENLCLPVFANVILSFLALRAAAASASGEITTSKLIEVLTDEFAPEGQDADQLDGRSDTYFSQKVRNLVSHRTSTASMFNKGYAEYIASTETIRITEGGSAFLAQVPDE